MAVVVVMGKEGEGGGPDPPEVGIGYLTDVLESVTALQSQMKAMRDRVMNLEAEMRTMKEERDSPRPATEQEPSVNPEKTYKAIKSNLDNLMTRLGTLEKDDSLRYVMAMSPKQNLAMQQLTWLVHLVEEIEKTEWAIQTKVVSLATLLQDTSPPPHMKVGMHQVKETLSTWMNNKLGNILKYPPIRWNNKHDPVDLQSTPLVDWSRAAITNLYPKFYECAYKHMGYNKTFKKLLVFAELQRKIVKVMPPSDQLKDGDEQFRVTMDIKHAGDNGLTDWDLHVRYIHMKQQNEDAAQQTARDQTADKKREAERRKRDDERKKRDQGGPDGNNNTSQGYCRRHPAEPGEDTFITEYIVPDSGHDDATVPHEKFLTNVHAVAPRVLDGVMTQTAGTLEYYMEIVQEGQTHPIYVKARVPNIRVRPGSTEICISVDHLMETKHFGHLGDRHTNHKSILTYRGWRVKRVEEPGHKSWKIAGRFDKPPPDRMENRQGPGVVSITIESRRNHNKFHAPDRVLNKLSEVVTKLPQGWHEGTIRTGDNCGVCAVTNQVNTKGTTRHPAVADTSQNPELPGGVATDNEDKADTPRTSTQETVRMRSPEGSVGRQALSGVGTEPEATISANSGGGPTCTANSNLNTSKDTARGQALSGVGNEPEAKFTANSGGGPTCTANSTPRVSRDGRIGCADADVPEAEKETTGRQGSDEPGPQAAEEPGSQGGEELWKAPPRRHTGRAPSARAPATVSVKGTSNRFQDLPVDEANETPGGDDAPGVQGIKFRPRRDGTAVDDTGRSTMDVYGPRKADRRGHTHALLILDDATDMAYVVTMKGKKNVPDQLRKYVCDPTMKTPKILRTDNESTVTKDIMKELRTNHGVHFEFSAPYSHFQVGRAEVAIKDIWRRALAMLTEAGLDESYWSWAFQHSAMVRNILPRIKNKGATSRVMEYYGTKANAQHIQKFGCLIAVHVSDEIRQKGDTPGTLGRYLGFARDQSGIEYEDIATGTFKVTSFEKYKVVNDDSQYDPELVGKFTNARTPANDPARNEAELRPSNMRVEELRVELAKRGKSTTGTKKVLVDRLTQAVVDRRSALRGETPNDFLTAGTMPQKPVADRTATPMRDQVVHSNHRTSQQGNKYQFVQYFPQPGQIRRTKWMGTTVREYETDKVANKRLNQVTYEPDADTDMHEAYEDLRKGVTPRTGKLKVEVHAMELCDDAGNPTIHTAPPERIEDLCKHPKFRAQWEDALKAEYDNLMSRDAFEDIKRSEVPRGVRVVDVKSVFELKFHSDGTFRKFKVRNVLRGFQMPKMTREQTWSPCPRIQAHRVLWANAAWMGDKIRGFDVVSAYLLAVFGESDPPVYVRVYNPHTRRFEYKRLKINLYGSPDGAARWNSLLTDVMVNKLGFEKPSRNEPCLFRGRKDKYEGRLNIVIHVDDGTAQVQVEADWDKFWKMFQNEFPATMEMTIKSNLGMKFDHTTKGIYVSQPVYVGKKLEQYGLTDDAPKSLPAQPSKQCYLNALVQRAKERGDYVKCDSNLFLSMINSLRFIERHTRPDISYPVGAASRYMHEPNNVVLEYMKDIWRYLGGTRNRGLFCARGQDNQPLKVTGWTDAEFGSGVSYATVANPKIAAPVGGGVVFLGTCPIWWWSGKLKQNCLSTGEAELIAAVETMRDIKALTMLLRTFKVEVPTPVMNTDSMTAKTWMTDGSKEFNRTRHIGNPYYWMIDQVHSKYVDIKFVRTADMVADIMTKPLPSPAFNRHANVMLRTRDEEEVCSTPCQ